MRTKRGNMGNMGMMPPGGFGMLFGVPPTAQPQPQSKEDKIKAVREEFEERTRQILTAGCDDPEHEKMHVTFRTLIRQLYTIEALPERAQEPFVRLVSDFALHRGDFDEAMPALLEAFQMIYATAYGIARAMEMPADQIGKGPVPEKEVGTGVYL